MRYSEILKRNTKLGKLLPDKKYEIKILSNIITSQLNEILEYYLRVDDIPAIVSSGDYDNIVQDSQKYGNSHLVIIFWELCNIIDGLHYKIELLNHDEYREIINKIKSEIDFVIQNLEKTPLVIINKFTSLSFTNANLNVSKLDELAIELNNYLQEKTRSNIKLIDIEKIITSIGISHSLDYRYYYSSKALYTIELFKNYSSFIKPFIMSANGKAKKALIFDCDNTLWKGIIGEEGFDNIEMSATTKEGAIFAEIQSMALALKKKGILIGLCSKNNPADVDEVIKTHPHMQLRQEYITINKSNWLDKATNLKEIAKELNIGLESLVFIDDSSFEVNFIKDQLPEVMVLQVPKKLYEYPKMLRDNIDLFYNLTFTVEDRKKVEMYKQQVKRENVKKEFTDINDYLASLQLKMIVFTNEESIIPRMSQMSQKTNQFNLTTKRYTEGDIQNFFTDHNYDIYAFSISDKFGESGITGLSIVITNRNNRTAEIDTFLMSCRVIGRNLEYAFMDYIIEKLKKNSIKKIKAKYIKSLKNNQVKEFYDNCSFYSTKSSDLIKDYKLDINQYQAKKLKYIEVINGK